MPVPNQGSSLTIAPLNTQPPLHLPATAAQTAASESLLDLWDAAPSGQSLSAVLLLFRPWLQGFLMKCACVNVEQDSWPALLSVVCLFVVKGVW